MLRDFALSHPARAQSEKGLRLARYPSTIHRKELELAIGIFEEKAWPLPYMNAPYTQFLGDFPLRRIARGLGRFNSSAGKFPKATLMRSRQSPCDE